MKRLVSIAVFCLALAACGGGSAATVSCRDYWDGTFGTCLPDDWVVIERETLRQRGVPEDTLVAFQSQVAVSGQFPTLAVTREALAQVMSPDVYSKANIRSVTVLPAYKEVDTRDVRIDEDTVTLHTFTAQPIAEEPMRRFYQASTVTEDGDGYTITATLPVSFSDDVEREIHVMFDEATFVEPEEE